ncbi:GNAT family N-acetyltransferase/peptidase C39 family protein [Marinobacter nanhaiticus D15-8W]|uniref:GNAT family N-acetyltransferase n=1 Tax=Marinobacter nanhaiticus D15-8W TaxID=626887 RepID=N6WTP2_9GAMM|nr:peptidase C39 family protein [Marinobacter nanhaiticus]ENO14407.1 GNAT family N-acetyltransferase [Marinobacter nanhaiticus D15-8W]BES71797.1 GNAT family N-acetyltransferase/peptidase C39 family protein [Marinobacter nanhaiticus D15-8W]
MSSVIRLAELTDLDALVALENRCFSEDRISRRSFRRFIEVPRDRVLVAEQDGKLLGYSLVLMHKATRLARIYSIAVSDEARGQGLGERLVRQSETVAVEAGRIIMRLEVREDNASAIRLYRRLGYRQFGTYRDYYEDHGTALRFERRILFFEPKGAVRPVPYYPQTTDFTCGPAALMMAMAAQCPERRLTTLEELRIWREATTIFMLAGHGGCGPHGLALAGWHRGFDITAYVSQEGALFKDTVRSEQKKRVLDLVHEGFIYDLAQTDIELHHEPITISVIEDALARGDVPVILVSTWHLNRSRVPHWVTVCAMDDQFVYLHDPEIDVEEGETVADKQYLPVDRGVFEKMARYGHQQRLQAVVIVGARREMAA